MKPKALIVEDDTTLLRNLRRFLELEGFDVDSATNGLEALDVLQQSAAQYDVIVTDLNMPKMGGMQFVKVLQSQAKTRNIPIIVLTAFGQKQNLLTALRSGVKDLIEKPWDGDELMASIHRVMSAPEDGALLVDNYATKLYDYLRDTATPRGLPSLLALRFAFSGQVKALARGIRAELLSTIDSVLKDVFPNNEWIFDSNSFTVTVFGDEGAPGEIHIESKAKLIALRARITKLFLERAPEHPLAVFAPSITSIYVHKGIITSHRKADKNDVLERLESILTGLKSSRGGVYLYTDASIPLPSLRLDMPSLINRAIEISNAEFSIAWQPQIDLIDGSIHGAEALARWNSPELGFVSPDRFISASEEWGLINKLGVLLRDRAMKEFKAMQAFEVTLPRMSFNVSPFELLDPSFAASLIEHVRSHEIPFEVLTAEITESASVLESEEGLQNLKLLKDSGMGLAVDDFGAGYTSLRALSEQPLTELKIDRSYVTGIADNPKLLAVVASIVRLAKDIGAISVVEGIECKEELDILRELGCDYGQGYYWSKPVPAEALGVLLRS